ncbi:type I glutamate--ammonia ligase [candidate division KSB1 bacterium]|nr:type I glutamate--ammonia ligase [candidate division KSB1 bacterium]
MTQRLEEVQSIIKQEDVKFLYLLFTDLTGVPKKITIRAGQLEDAAGYGIWFDGSSIEGFARIYESDMLLRPDLETFTVLPWTVQSQRAAQLICDVYTPDDKPFPGDPRGTLKRNLELARQIGYRYMVGPEVEFFLLERDQLPKLVPHDRKGYFDLSVNSRAVKICQDAMDTLAQMGIKCETYHHEVSQGQHEIDLHYGDALTIADSLVTLKQVLRTHANGSGLKITFMPKPIFGIAGNGMHVHQSLADYQGNNAFFDSRGHYHLSSIAFQFLAGQLAHARALASVLAPTVNSYKRLVPGFEAPVYICWGQINRSALIRVPRVTAGKAAVATRLELRCPDPAANPYLALSAMLAAGLDGMQNKMTPPKPIEENVYDFDDAKLAALHIDTLPSTLSQAAGNFDQDELLKQALGEHITKFMLRAQMQQWQEFLMQVTPWELERYL